jgi:hypothetical protein
MKSIYTNQEKKEKMQIQTTMVHEPNHRKHTFHMIHYGLDLGGITNFLLVMHYVHGDGVHNEMAICF